MSNLFFGSTSAVQTTVLVIILIAFVICALVKRNKIQYWGRMILVALVLGLYICIVAAIRDEYHLSVQYAIDGSVQPGVFEITGFQSIVNCILALVIVVCGLLCIFKKEQKIRQTLFFVLSGSMLLKVLTIEVSRIILFLTG